MSRPAPRLEGRPDAHVHRRGLPVGEGGVDAVPGGDQVVLRARGSRSGSRASGPGRRPRRPRPRAGRARRGTGWRPRPRPRRSASGSASRRRSRRRPRPAAPPGYSNSGARRQHLRVALRLGAEAEVLPHRDASRPRASRPGCGCRSPRRGWWRTRDRTGSRPAPRRRRPSITSRLISNGMISFGRRVRVEHAQRVGLEGQDRVGPVDHLPVPDVDAVEGPDRDVPGSAFGVRQSR